MSTRLDHNPKFSDNQLDILISAVEWWFEKHQVPRPRGIYWNMLYKSELAGVFNPFSQKIFLAHDLDFKEAFFVLFHELHHWKRFLTVGSRLWIDKDFMLRGIDSNEEEDYCSREARIDEKEFQQYLAGKALRQQMLT